MLNEDFDCEFMNECEAVGGLDTVQKTVKEAIELIVQYGGIDGAHHKDWVLDQVVRKLAGEQYDEIVAEAKKGEDGDETYSWECGIAP